ncbi:6-phosphogluconate dehydrogenase [Flavobacterium orientale]|uniref:6-phosphogluconate dehydrogenase n=1 Tax=Flavobacterium orientale TaxID=1756020 RepID=A0A917D9S4_9FLAO|nr:6-phosphogluconate dehydrogenase [Flavobacterium orientale]GGD14608.1 6-phosphogluconate dehydrogenase [Flavobacterium orientale]
METSPNKTTFAQKVAKYFKRFLFFLILAVFAFFTVIYYVPYSEGFRSGELIKISRKGVVFKTWEGEMSQGISGAQIFKFSIANKEKQVVADLEKYQGKYVKLTYVERYRAFSWWGDTRYFVTHVEEEDSPFVRPKQNSEQ